MTNVAEVVKRIFIVFGSEELRQKTISKFKLAGDPDCAVLVVPTKYVDAYGVLYCLIEYLADVHNHSKTNKYGLMEVDCIAYSLAQLIGAAAQYFDCICKRSYVSRRLNRNLNIYSFPAVYVIAPASSLKVTSWCLFPNLLSSLDAHMRYLPVNIMYVNNDN